MCVWGLGLLFCVACGAAPSAASAPRTSAQPTPTQTAPGETEASIDPALVALRADPSWLLPADACPRDVLPVTRADSGDWLAERCDEDLGGCLGRCRANEPEACYAAALEAQRWSEERLSEALFLRGCQLGHASACTNRAAGILMLEPQRADRFSCSARTFEETCRRRDAWGCTMYGEALLYGNGVPADSEQARSVLPFACGLDADHEACIKARVLLEELERGSRDPKSPLM